MNENSILLNSKIEPNDLKSNINNYMGSEEDVIRSLTENKYVNEVLFSFKIDNYKKYSHLEMLAIDKLCGGGKKLYLGFLTKADKVKFIKNYKFKNLYEIITNEIVKPYFDIDYKTEKEHKTDEEVKIILERFILEYNTHFRLPIVEDKIYVYAKRDDKTKKFKSIHIVMSGFKTTKAELKMCATHINKQRKANSFIKLFGALDINVYGTRKLFSLPHQRKLGKREYFDWLYCFKNDKIKYGDDAIYHYLINDVKNCEFNDYTYNPIDTQELQNELIMKEEATEKINKIITTGGMIKITPLNIVDKLLEYLPQEFFESSKWKHITRQIVMNKFNGYEKWLEESANRTDCYDGNKNKIWGANLDIDTYATFNLTDHLNRINNDFNFCFVWDGNNYFTQELMDWICKTSNVKQTDLTSTIKRYKDDNSKSKEPKKEIMVGNNYVFYLNKQVLINEIKQTINHFGLETNFNNQYGVDDTKFKLIKQCEIIEEMNMFLKSIHRLSGWKMLWGSGKTYYGVNTIKKYALENDMRILFLTENNNLNIEMTASLGGISHLDIKEYKLSKQDVIDSRIIISSLESLKTTLFYNDKTPFDIIIFDEYESLINHFISSTFKKVSQYEVSELIRKLVRDANKIICLDCDLSEERMNIVNNIFIDDDNDDNEIQLYKCEYNSWADYKYIIHTNKQKMTDAMNNDIFNNDKRILYPTNSIKDAKTIYKLLLRQSKKLKKTKNIMIISSDGVEYNINGVEYNGANVSEWKKDLKEFLLEQDEKIKLKQKIDIGKYASVNKNKLFKNVENSLIELQIEILIYSPSMTCGISFGNSKTEFMFDKLYGYATNGSICARAFLQMVHRCRNIKDKEMNLNIKNGLTKITPIIDASMIEPLIMKHQQLKFCEEEFWKEIDMEKFEIDKFYKEIIISCVKEKQNSNRNFMQELLGKTKINHGLKVCLKHIFKLTEQTETSTKDDYDEIKKINCADTIMLLQLEEKITESQYNHFKNETNENDGADNRHKVNKYYLLENLRINKSNNKFMINEVLQDKEKQQDGYYCDYNKNDDDNIGREWKLKSDLMGETSGVFKSYSLDADEVVYHYNNHKVNKYYIDFEKSRDQLSFMCYYDNNSLGEFIKIDWKLKSDIYTSNGLFKHHKIDGRGDFYYYGGDVKVHNDMIEKLKEKNDDCDGDDYFDLDDIIVEKYDKDLLIQHSKKLAEIYKSPFIERLNRLNNNIISGYKYENDNKKTDDKNIYNNFKMKDMKNNKLIIIKKIIDMMGIDRQDLIYKRKILSNGELKNLLQDNAIFIQTQLINYYNTMDIDCEATNKINITKFNSSNIKHYKYVKDIITTYLNYIGITHNHYNKNGKRGFYVYNNDDCLTTFQYELFGKTTFINTYYDTIKNDIYYYLYQKNRTINDIINQQTMEENMMAKKQYKRLDKKFETRQNAIFKRNRYITYQIGDVEKSLKIPFNLMTADYIVDNQDNIIYFKNKTKQDRIEIYLKIELDNPTLNPSYKMDKLKSTKNDIQYYKYNEIVWKQHKQNDFYIKEQVVKYTADKNKEDNIIKVKSQATEDVVNDILNDMIDTIVLKDDFKNMVNDEINIGGEQEQIKKDYETLLTDELDISRLNANDTQFKTMRPNVKIM